MAASERSLPSTKPTPPAPAIVPFSGTTWASLPYWASAGSVLFLAIYRLTRSRVR